jgi:hypothetical protein
MARREVNMATAAACGCQVTIFWISCAQNDVPADGKPPKSGKVAARSEVDVELVVMRIIRYPVERHRSSEVVGGEG